VDKLAIWSYTEYLTRLRGLYAVGDLSSPISHIGIAVTNGAIAPFFINRELIKENLAFQNS
jgi:thioredoxin reductase